MLRHGAGGRCWTLEVIDIIGVVRGSLLVGPRSRQHTLLGALATADVLCDDGQIEALVWRQHAGCQQLHDASVAQQPRQLLLVVRPGGRHGTLLAALAALDV